MLIRATYIIGAAIYFLAVAFGVHMYPGIKSLYLLFSLVYLLVFFGGVYRQNSYGYMFFSIFSWLGFWAKYTIHLILGGAFIEPIGNFSPLPNNLDEVILVSIWAGLGIIVGGLLLRKTGDHICYEWPPIRVAHSGYGRISPWAWTTLLFVMLCAAIGNILCGISQTGLVPKVSLPWPLSGVVPWIFSTGFALCAVAFLSWDIASRKSPFRGLYLVIFESFLSSVSLLSRGVFLLHTLPIVAFFQTKLYGDTITRLRIKFSIAAAIWGVAFAASFLLVNSLRSQYFLAGQNGWLNSSELRREISIFVPRVISIAVDRWIGIEGVMAVQSYDGKSMSFWMEAAGESRAVNKMGIYQSVCKYRYEGVDLDRYNFGSVPGAPAFFYYSGSFCVVFGGMAVLSLALILTEFFVYRFTANPFLCSFWGIVFANMFAQFAMSPRQMGWQSLLMVVSFYGLGLCQKLLLGNVGRKQGNL